MQRIYVTLDGWTDKSNGCNGRFGGEHEHQCVQKPGYKPRSYCVLPESNENEQPKSYIREMSAKK